MDAILEQIFKHKITSSVLCIILIVGIIYEGFFMGTTDTTIGVIGTLITTFGFILTIVQLKSVKEVALETKKEVSLAVKQVQDRVKEVLSISELTNAIKIIDEIEIYIHSNKYEIAALRLKEIYKITLSIEARKNLDKIYDKKISFVLRNMSLDINNLTDNIDTPSNIEKSKISPNLRDASTILYQVENYLKSKSYDTSLL